MSIGKYLWWYGNWVWRHEIKKEGHSEEDKVYLTRKLLQLSEYKWNVRVFLLVCLFSFVCVSISLSFSLLPSLPPSFPPSLPPSFLPDSVTLDNYTTLMQCFPPTPYQMLPADKQADLVELELWHESNFLEFKKAQEEETKCRLAQNNKYKMYRSGGVLFHSVKFGELY